MPNALRATGQSRLDALGAVGLSGMDGEGNAQGLRPLEQVGEIGRWIERLSTRQVDGRYLIAQVFAR